MTDMFVTSAYAKTGLDQDKQNLLDYGRRPVGQAVLYWHGCVFFFRCFGYLFVGLFAGLFFSSAAYAAAETFLSGLSGLASLSLLGGVSCATLLGGWLVRADNRRKNAKICDLARRLDDTGQQSRTVAHVLAATGQRVVIWQGRGAKAEVFGHLPEECGLPCEAAEFLDFRSWLAAAAADRFHSALYDLQHEGERFDLHLETAAGRYLHSCGRVCGAQAIVQFYDITAHVRDNEAHKHKAEVLGQELQTIHNLLEQLEQPVWLRDKAGQLVWSNPAWQKAVDGDTAQELLTDAARQKICESHAQGAAFHDKISAVIEGDRHILAVHDVAGPSGSAGIATNETESEHLRSELKRIVQGYSETFDQLSTAVAIFDPEMKLEFFNQAFASLWPLEISFLESHPSHTLILDRLREKGILNEQPDWRRWKEDLFDAYRALAPQLHIWNLPDGRTLRVVANPHPQGGVTWLYEDLTEKLNLEARYNTLIRMQGETLDNLSEGVAVFGADGRVRLSNPAFSKLWSLTPELGVEGTHIAKIEAFCLLRAEGKVWQEISACVTGFADKRDCITGRMDLFNGDVLDYALVPLPQGQSMLTFVNVTDSVQVSRALHERNEALEFADRLRNDFVQHVSYELRTPLTNIIGFTDLLRSPAFGSLNARQHDYLKHIAAESVTLLNIVNDILDLATVDAGIMELDIAAVNIADSMDYAIARMDDRLVEKHITVAKQIMAGIGSFHADGARIRQVLVNLLSNAVNFAPAHSTVRFTACSEAGEIIFSVHDDGCGIPDSILDTVFKRFSAHAHHGYKPGAGLGLSIVKSFVELHHGSVTIDTGPQKGTTVICRFPAHMPVLHVAAE